MWKAGCTGATGRATALACAEEALELYDAEAAAAAGDEEGPDGSKPPPHAVKPRVRPEQISANAELNGADFVFNFFNESSP
jgi:hypothetical protein